MGYDQQIGNIQLVNICQMWDIQNVKIHMVIVAKWVIFAKWLIVAKYVIPEISGAIAPLSCSFFVLKTEHFKFTHPINFFLKHSLNSCQMNNFCQVVDISQI